MASAARGPGRLPLSSSRPKPPASPDAFNARAQIFAASTDRLAPSEASSSRLSLKTSFVKAPPQCSDLRNLCLVRARRRRHAQPGWVAAASSDASPSLPPAEFSRQPEVLDADAEEALLLKPVAAGASSNGAAVDHTPSDMAEAFGIAPATALAVTSGLTASAFVLPLAMNVCAPGAPPQVRALTYLTLLLGFYMAWNIGANDVANAMGTSVGSGALTLRQAVLTAAILEFGGAFLVGSHVSHTMQSGIIRADVFASRPGVLFSGMLASLAASGTWLQVASFFGWPVSTTHCIIGAMVGFGLVYGGLGAVYWASLARVVSSWVISPLFGASISYIVYRCIRTFVYDASNPGQAACRLAPTLVFVGVAAFSLSSLAQGGPLLWPLLQSFAAGTIAAVLVSAMIDRQLGELLGDFCEIPKKVQVQRVAPKGPLGTQLRIVYVVFGYLQVLSACFMSFAHGANDVANAIGPILAALSILQGPGAPPVSDSVATRVLVWGGFGIVAGLLVWGYRVIATIGKKITELTPTRGFAAEFSAATVVVVASRMGLPISATHTLVGAVMGVGLARGLNSVRADVIKEIATSWVVTIPIGATLSVIYAFLIQRIVPAVF